MGGWRCSRIRTARASCKHASLPRTGGPWRVLAVAEGGGDGPQRAWRETVATVPWFADGCDPSDFRNPPDGPWVITALLPELAYHLEALDWLGAVEQYIGWAFLDSLRPMASA